MQFINKSLQIADPQAFGSRGKALLASKTKLKDIGFLEKDIIHYLFDFGEMWWHRIRFQSINEINNQKKYIKIIKEFG